MTIEECYREECDTIRLLIEEFRITGARHLLDNLTEITSPAPRDIGEYVRPTAIHGILGFLGAALVVNCISLLEFRLPKLVVHCLRSRGRQLTAETQIYTSGNVLGWMKDALKEAGVEFDCGDSLYERLAAWIKVRNDLVHNGGYRSEKVTQRHIDILEFVSVGAVGTLYDVPFKSCENAIQDVEAFFGKTYRVLTEIGKPLRA